MSFTNVYYKRTAGTERACYVCYKPTTTVLATINTVDFLYTCDAHLADRGFASSLAEVDGRSGGRNVVVSEEEIAKVKEEWEKKQKAKLEKEKKNKSQEKEETDKKEGEDSKNKDKEGSKISKPAVSPSMPTPSPPTHEKYALHRDYFAMRQSEHRKRRQAAQAKELAPRLPGAPSGAVGDKH